jgi:hypothetical protein
MASPAASGKGSKRSSGPSSRSLRQGSQKERAGIEISNVADEECTVIRHAPSERSLRPGPPDVSQRGVQRPAWASAGRDRAPEGAAGVWREPHSG